MNIIGKISATKSQPTSADDFCFWVKDDTVIAPFDIVSVENMNGSKTIGVVKEIFHITDSDNHISSYVSYDFGSIEGEAMTARLGTVFATAEVLNNNKEVYMPLRDGASVLFASEEEIKQALGIDVIDDSRGHKKIPSGFLSLSNNISVPVCLDSAFLIGPEGAHLNISGISGLATKTSYAMFLLQSISQKAKNESIATIIFNVKGNDLLYVDEPNPDLTEHDKNDWKRCELDPIPFSNVTYFLPYFNEQAKAYTNSWCARDKLEERQKQGKAHNFVYTYDHDRDKLDLLFSNIDDPNFTIEAIMNEIISGREFENIRDWEQLFLKVSEKCMSGQERGGSIPVVSWRRFKRLLGTHIRNNTKGIFQDAKSSNQEKHQVSLSEHIEQIKKGDVFVIDIAELEEQEKCLVFGDVIRTVYKLKTEGDAECPDKIVMFVDELNKYAPENIKSSPIINDLLEITERGRSLGIVLFSAEQFRSAVHSRVKGNCGTNVYGRTNAIEIASADYRYIPKTYNNMMTRLKKGHLIIQHPIFRTLLKIIFPKPAYMQPGK